MVATTCPFPILGISPSESGEFCFRFRVLLFYATQKWLNKFSAYKKLASITVGYLDMETMNIVTTQMYIDGYQVKLVSDTSYGSLWEVSFTLKEF